MSPEESAFHAAELRPEPRPEPTRRLSPLRVLLLVLALAAAGAGVVAFRSATTSSAVPVVQSDFMPYVDVTATPQYAFEAPHAAWSDPVLGFVVSSRADRCAPSWGAAYSPAQAATALDLDRRIARLRQLGGDVAVSFGGVANTELAAGCADPGKLLAAYRSIVTRYQLATIDLDIEGDTATAPAASRRRATAISALQRERLRAGHPLRVWLTLPVDPTGLTASGSAVLADMLGAGVRLAGVNGLTMDYGASLPAGTSMLQAAESALTGLARQVRSAYAAHGVHLSSAEVWQRLGATPMIGQNDVPAERFGVDDAHGLLAFARRSHLRRLSMWSLNRDQDCGPNYANVTVVSDVCSGVAQRPGEFSAIFSPFRSRAAKTPLRQPESPTTGVSTAQPTAGPTSIVDNPATSPYPIWNPDLPYPAGTKIVWHRNVYQAKWWTKGDTPDAPVQHTYDTPWTLIGPVLPGDHPQPTPTVSAGTYPAWSPTAVYRAGDRVVYGGVGYQAKWYTRGDVPGITVSDPGQTPWKLITSR